MAGNGYFDRTERLVGPEVMERLGSVRIILLGMGGVGSWCAEALVRSGVINMTLVDGDRIAETNVNRQLMATSRNIGAVKVEAMRERLLEINPDASIRAVEDVFTAETAERFDLDSYDYIIDAIDSLKDKSALILRASETRACVYSSMGAALKLDPTAVQVAEFWDVRGCPLAAAIRKKYRREHTMPSKKVTCVFGAEVLPNLGAEPDPSADPGLFKKAQINGTSAPVTGIFGLTLAGLILQDIYRKTLHP